MPSGHYRPGCLVANDVASFFELDRTSENFRGRRGATINQYRQLPVKSLFTARLRDQRLTLLTRFVVANFNIVVEDVGHYARDSCDPAAAVATKVQDQSLVFFGPRKRIVDLRIRQIKLIHLPDQ